MLRTTLAALATLLLWTTFAPDSTRAQQREPLRVAFLGDSLTIGLNATSPDLMYRAIMTRRLLGETPYGVHLGVFQDPYGLTDDALRRVHAVVDFRPDVVILEIGNHEVFASDEYVTAFDPLYDQLLDELQATGAVVIAGTVAWLNYPADSPEFGRAMRVNAAIRRLCARRGITVADLWTPTVFRPDYISRPGDWNFIEPYDGDDLHPNDAGHAALADAFWRAYQADRARRTLSRLISAPEPSPSSAQAPTRTPQPSQ